MSTINGASLSGPSSARVAGKTIPMTSTKELRPRVVEILANTANGCLSELGYYPGMKQRLQQAEETAKRWQDENVKLFADNRKLSAAYQTAIAALQTNGKDALLAMHQDNERLRAELQRAGSEIAVLISEKGTMQKRLDMLLSGKEMQAVLAQHEDLRKLFARIWDENQQLKEFANGHRQNGKQHQAYQPPATSINHPSSTSHHHAPTQETIPAEQVISYGQPIVPTHASGYYPRASSSASSSGRPSSSASTSSLGARQRALTINTGTYVHPPPAHLQYIPPNQGVIYMYPPTKWPPSNGLPPQQPTNVHRWPQHPPSTLPTPPPLHHPVVPRRSSWASSTSSSLQHAVSPPPTSAPPAPSSANTQFSPLPTFSRSSVSEPESAHASSSENPPPPPSEVSSRRTPSTSCSPEQTHEALTPISPPVGEQGSLLLKRSSMDVGSQEDDVLMGEISRKRPRIAAPPLPEATLVESPVAEGIGGSSEQMIAEETTTTAGVDEEVKREMHVDELDVPSEELEAGANDVEVNERVAKSAHEPFEKTLEDRLGELLYQSDDGVFTTCLLCMRRYSKGTLKDQPQPFSNATLEQLVDHLTTQHPSAWEKTLAS